MTMTTPESTWVWIDVAAGESMKPFVDLYHRRTIELAEATPEFIAGGTIASVRFSLPDWGIGWVDNRRAMLHASIRVPWVSSGKPDASTLAGIL